MSTKIIAGNIKLTRAYERATASDGTRILIDRLWPRGLKKADAAIDQWVKDLAPSTALRKWFGHDPPGGKNSAVATPGRYTSIVNSLISSAPWHENVQ